MDYRNYTYQPECLTSVYSLCIHKDYLSGVGNRKWDDLLAILPK